MTAANSTAGTFRSTPADREAALASRSATELPPQPFDAGAGYRALKQRWREDAQAKPGAVRFAAIQDPVINPIEWESQPVPPRLWIADQWIPFGTTTAFYGDGGTGKSLIAQMLMTASAVGAPWLGIPTVQCRSFGYFCEDTAEELHRRQDAINRMLSCSYRDLDAMRLQPRVGLDNVLMQFDGYGQGVLTPAFDDLVTECMDHKARLCIVDTAADTFGGNENIRPQVRQFIGACLGNLARKIHGSVLLLAHPSRSGLATGEGDGGNTAWNASVRSRLYLSRPKHEGDEPADDLRVLSRRKANYASVGDAIDLVWRDGCFVPKNVPTGVFATIERNKAEAAFLAALDKLTAQGVTVSAQPTARNYAPITICRAGMAGGHRKAELATAMQALFDGGKIVVQQYGRPSDRHSKITRSQP